MKVEKGMLVYIPSGVRLVKTETNEQDYDIYVKEYRVTEKPTNCLVLESGGNRDKKCKIIYEGTTWYVNRNSVYKIDKEKANVSETRRSY